MNRANKALVVAMVSALGIWGCASGSGNGTADRTKVLEDKVAKLEQDFLAAATARDEFRVKLENEMAQLQVVVKERDELKKQIHIRTGERDALQGQYDQFRKSLRDLLGRAETGQLAPESESVTSALGLRDAN
jgi:hypothetical protein